MRTIGWILALVVVLGGGLAVWLANQSTEPTPWSKPAAPGEEPEPAAVALAGEEGARQPVPGGQQPKPQTEPAHTPPQLPPAEPDRGRVRILVRDRWSGRLLGNCRWRFAGHRVKPVDGKSIQPGPITVHAPTNVDLAFSVEVPGFTPAEPRTVRLTQLQPLHKLEFSLIHAAPFTGVELRVLTSDGKPVTDLAVRAGLQQDGAAQELWHRRAHDAKGIFRLPDLRPGNYRFSCQPLDANKLPDFRLPFEHKVEFNGSGLHIHQYVCAVGGRIRLTLRRHGKVTGKDMRVKVARVEDGRAAAPVHCLWAPLDDQGKRLRESKLGQDGLSQSAPAVLHLPIPTGTYRVSIGPQFAPLARREITVNAATITSVQVDL